MRQRPMVFDLLALVFLLIAISLPIQVMMLFGHLPTEFSAVIHKLSPMNWGVAILAVACAVAHWRASPALWALSPLFIAAVAWNNHLVAKAGLNYDMTTTIIATVATIGVHGLLLTPMARKALLNPSMRWWLTAPRKRANLAATVWPVLGGELLTSTYDISEGGAFFALDESSWSRGRGRSMQNLGVGSVCAVKVKLGEKAIHCNGEVVRQCEARGNYPGGFAVRFKDLSRDDRRMLHEYMRDIPRIGGAASSGGSSAAGGAAGGGSHAKAA
jgi:hypothetical protein